MSVTVQEAENKKETKKLLPRVVAISSGKGGVGKSSITVNLGITLAKSGARVCLLDADTGLANANILLGLTPQFSLEHVLFGAKPIEDVMVDGPHGLKVVPGANGISECVSLHPRQQLRLTRELARIENDFDYILIDTAAGIADTTLDFVSASHHTIIVITPEPTSLTDAFSLIKLLKRRRKSIAYQVVVNMCADAGQARAVYHRFESAVTKYIGVDIHSLGYILRDESMRAAVVLQNPVAMFPDTDPSSRGFIRLADSLDNATREIPVRNSFSAYWHRQFRQQRRGGEDGSEAGAGPQAVAGPSPEQSRDRDYLAEMRSRLLLLIEQGHLEQGQIAAVLRDAVERFTRRFEHSPVDALRLVEQLVESPERNDELLRGIAERVKPWGPPETVRVINGIPDPGPESATARPEPARPVPDNKPVTADAGDTDQSLSPPAVATVRPRRQDGAADGQKRESPARRGIHHYDTSRFGSQDHLLDMLRRMDSEEHTLAAFLSSLV